MAMLERNQTLAAAEWQTVSMKVRRFSVLPDSHRRINSGDRSRRSPVLYAANLSAK